MSEQCEECARWYDRWSASVFERDRLAGENERLRKNLQRAYDYCARPAGVCFDPTLLSSAGPPQVPDWSTVNPDEREYPSIPAPGRRCTCQETQHPFTKQWIRTKTRPACPVHGT